MIRYLKILINAKYEFKKPKKSKYLIFDYHNSFIFYKYLREDYTILYCRFEKINLYVLIINLLKGKFSKLDYYNSFVKFVNPKIIFSGIDNNPNFYLLNKDNHQMKFLVQNQWKSGIYDRGIFLDKRVEAKKYSMDKVFVFNNFIGEYFKKLNPVEIISIGSFKSNLYKIKKIEKIYDLLFISSWSDMKLNYQFSESMDFRKYSSLQLETIKNIGLYAKEKNLQIFILGKKSGILENKEYNFYKEIFQNNKWNYLKRDKISSYHKVDRAKIVLNFHSTLGYESLSRGNKTIFFDPFSNYIKTVNFGWPYKNFKKNGIFWTQDVTFKNIKKIIDNLRNINESKFKKICNEYCKKTMLYDYDNKKFQSMFSKELIKINL